MTETFTNLRPADIALWIEVNITAQAEPPGCVLRQWNSHVTELGSTCIDVGGHYNLSHSASFGWMKFYDGHGTGQHDRLPMTFLGCDAFSHLSRLGCVFNRRRCGSGPVYNDPPFNPSLYVRGVRSGLGAVALDDWMRRGLRMHKANRSGFWGVHQFGVPAGAAVTYSWALFPTINSTDYCAFTALAFEHRGRFGVRSLAAFRPSRTRRDFLAVSVLVLKHIL